MYYLISRSPSRAFQTFASRPQPNLYSHAPRSPKNVLRFPHSLFTSCPSSMWKLLDTFCRSSVGSWRAVVEEEPGKTRLFTPFSALRKNGMGGLLPGSSCCISRSTRRSIRQIVIPNPELEHGLIILCQLNPTTQPSPHSLYQSIYRTIHSYPSLTF